MPSIFSPADNATIVKRLKSLTPSSQRLWGKMSIEQMLEHCTRPLDVASGRLQLKRGLLGLLFGSMAKKQLLAPVDFKQNLPTAPQFIVKTNSAEFEKIRTELVQRVEEFASRGTSILTTSPHPFFGKLSMEEWDTLQWKHLDHHLRQFGV